MPIEKEIQDILKADDTLNRMYVDPSAGTEAYPVHRVLQNAAHRPVAAFAQELPAGCGLEPIESGSISIAVPGRTEPIVVNRYVTARGEKRA